MSHLPELAKPSVCREPSPQLAPSTAMRAREACPASPFPGRLPLEGHSQGAPLTEQESTPGIPNVLQDLQSREKSTDKSVVNTSCVNKSGFNSAAVKIWKAVYLSRSSIHHGRWEDGHHCCFGIQDAFFQHCGMLLHTPH